jgi:hypothetical protein
MATIDQMTKTFQVVLKTFGLPEIFGCHINYQKLVTNFFVYCSKNLGKYQIVLGSDKIK